MDNFIKQIEDDFNELGKKYNIIWLNDKVRQETIDKINNSGNRKENYRKVFKKAARAISKEWAHLLVNNSNKGVKDEPAGAGKVMSINFEIKTAGKLIKKKYFEISKIIIGEQYISRKMLIPRY